MSRTGNRAHEENTRRTRSTGTINDLDCANIAALFRVADGMFVHPTV